MTPDAMSLAFCSFLAFLLAFFALISFAATISAPASDKSSSSSSSSEDKTAFLFFFVFSSSFLSFGFFGKIGSATVVELIFAEGETLGTTAELEELDELELDELEELDEAEPVVGVLEPANELDAPVLPDLGMTVDELEEFDDTASLLTSVITSPSDPEETSFPKTEYRKLISVVSPRQEAGSGCSSCTGHAEDSLRNTRDLQIP